MFKEIKIRKFIKDKLKKEDVRIIYGVSSPTISGFDKCVDEFGIYLFVLICKYFNKKPWIYKDITHLLTSLAEEIKIPKKDASRKETTPLVLFQWLNESSLPMLVNYFRFSCLNPESITDYESLIYINCILDECLKYKKDNEYVRMSILFTVDYFSKIMKSIIQENVNKAKETGHSPFEPMDNIFH